MIDDDFHEALGIDKDGRCLRHPNIQVAVVSTSGDGDRTSGANGCGSTHAAKVQEVTGTIGSATATTTNFLHVKECLICRSEIDGGGVMQRKSMAYAIQSVQNLHGNEEEWKSFKQNWGTEEETENDDGDKTNQSSDIVIGSKSEGNEKQEYTSLQSAMTIADDRSGFFDKDQTNFRLALLRASQVQRWNTIQKNKEILVLQKKLDEVLLEKTQIQEDFEAEKERLVNEISDLQSKVKKQEKTIEEELKIIKSIATKRAGARSSDKTNIIDATSYTHHLKTTAVLREEAPPQMPARKASEVVGIETEGIGVVGHTLAYARTKDQHPTKPVRQASDQHQGILAQKHSSDGSQMIHIMYPIDRNISFNNHRNNVAPSLPLRQPSQDTQLTKEFSDMTLSMVTETEYSAASSSDHFVRSEVTMDTETDEILPKRIVNASGGRNGGRLTRPVSSQPVRLGSSQEISFVPTEMEILAEPPHLRSQSPESTVGKHKNDKTDVKSMSGSQEIEFDAAVAFDDSINTARKHSVNEMKFDESQKLLMEASRAFSLSSLPVPLHQKHKKAETASSGTSKSGSDAERKEIVFPGSPDPISRKKTSPAVVFDSIQSNASGGVFGNAAVATEEDEENDEYDYFDSIPGELPVSSDRFLECHRASNNISPVSALTSGSYMYDSNVNGDDDDDEIEPMKGLHEGGATKQLPMEANFDSDDEDEQDGGVTPKKKPSKLDLAAQLREIDLGRPSKKKSSPKKSKKTIHLEDTKVHDKYGDSGLYTGTVLFENHLPHGNGHMKYENGREYSGDWNRGRWHGTGRWVNPNGDCYEGTFVYDARHGTGTYTWQNGNMYAGDFHDDKRQGRGTFHFANGNVYEGNFVNGVFEGEGRYTFEGGSYEGEWRSGRYHGQGILRFADGSTYQGRFLDGVADGEGVETSANGTVRQGHWKAGRPTESDDKDFSAT